MSTIQRRLAGALAFSGLLVVAASASAATDVYFRVDSVVLPAGAIGNPAPITMWRFVQTDSGFSVPAPSSTGWTPGPAVVANEGDTLNVHVQNNLPASSPAAYTEPVSVVIPGQTGVFTPTWTDGTTGPRTSPEQRVRSFTAETPQGVSSTYTFTSLKAGTYLYQSGTHPAVQLQMGLYGVLKVLPTNSGVVIPGRAYHDPSSAFDNEATVLLSEIDPLLHNAVATGQYGPNGAPPPGWLTSTIDYHPSYFLVNGLPYPGTPSIPAGAANQRLLLRFLNAGLETKVPTVLGPHMAVIAEDGNFVSVTNGVGTVVAAPRYQYNVLLPAGKTMDAILVPTTPYNVALVDRRLNLTNAGASPGGMMTSLSFGISYPPPWVEQDIGSVGQSGSASYVSGTFSVKGSGAGITGTADQFHFVYQALTGDGEIKAKVLSVQNTAVSSTAGVMIRDGLLPNAAEVMMSLRNDGRGFFRRRLTTGGTTSTTETTLAIPYWVRLVRSGNVFTAYRSTNGTTWTTLGSPVTIPMGSNVFVGLAVTSFNNAALNTSTFNNVTVIQGGPVNHAPGVTSPGNQGSVENDAINLPIVASDVDGDVLTYSASGLPPGLGIDPSTGVISGTISGTASSGSPYAVTVTAKDPSLASGSASFSWTVAALAAGLPAPWVQQDIGAVGQAGSGSFASGTFTVKGSGADIYGTSDQFHFVYQTLSGDGEIKARVVSVQNTNTWAKAGVMIRETTGSNSAFALMLLSAGGSGTFQRRLTTGGTAASSNVSGLGATYWVRLVRSGTTITAYRSATGASWTAVGSPITIGMASNVLVGLAVTSHNNAALCTSTFDNVTVVP